ncbi:MAG: pilus assembly protein N-terminal domain-containing protein [Planctomycetaceae bacterium]|nr:pilus assembly protein N-terminal domain-containing protein [Planctomycetaceae bacterium]
MHSRRNPQWLYAAVLAGLLLTASRPGRAVAQPPLPMGIPPVPAGVLPLPGGGPAAPGVTLPQPQPGNGGSGQTSGRPSGGTPGIGPSRVSAPGPVNQAPAADYDTDQAAQSESIVQISGRRMRVQIVERFARVLQMQNKILRVDGFDPEVISISTIDRRPDQVRAHAIKPGVTTIILVDEFGSVHEVEVFVTGDVRHLQAYIDRFFPRASVRAVAVRDSVVLRGYVTQPEHITELVEIAEQFYPRVLNQMKVGGVQQVKLKVRVMEAQRSKIRQLGLNFLYNNETSWLSSTPGTLTPLNTLTAAAGSAPTLGVLGSSLSDPSVAFGVVNDNSLFQGFLEALKTEGLLKIKAEPELVTTNGRPATLLNGGEFPILVPQSLGTVTVEWREFGVRLEAVPIILGGGRLRLEVQPEVSERDFANAVDINGTRVPGLTTRRVNTQVEMKFGQTLMIAGLISSRETADSKKIPFLGELPWLGAAFRRTSYDEVETELVIMVTPELVAPLQYGQVPEGGPGQYSATPTDRELYRDGFLEVPNYGDECQDCGPNGGTDGYPGGPGAGSPSHLHRVMPSAPAPLPTSSRFAPDRLLPPGGASSPAVEGSADAPPPPRGPEDSDDLKRTTAPADDPFQSSTGEKPAGGKPFPRTTSRFMRPGSDDFGGPSPFNRSPFRPSGSSASLYSQTKSADDDVPPWSTETPPSDSEETKLIEPGSGLIAPASAEKSGPPVSRARFKLR